MGFIFFIIAVFGFGLLVFVHEFGHFIMGKLFKIRVETFSIGLGPAIFGFKKGETYYQIGAIPLGGFCKFKGEETLEDLPVKFTINMFEDIKGKIRSDTTKKLLIDNYKLGIPDEISKDDFEEYVKIFTKEDSVELLKKSYEFSQPEKKYILKLINDEDYKKIFKILNNKKNLLKYNLKKETSKDEKKVILKAIGSEMKIYNLREPDSFYGAPPYKRLFVVLFGPLMNYLIAILFLSILAMFPHKEYFQPTKIMLIDDAYIHQEKKESPAKKAGLITGDIILKIDDKNVYTFTDISEQVYNKKDNIKLLISRNGDELKKIVRPEWDPSNMKYFIGIYSYLDPIIKEDVNNKLQKELGLKDKDKIIGIDNNFDNWSVINVQLFLETNFSKNKKSIIHIKRNDKVIDIPIVFNEINHKVSEDEFYFNYYTLERMIKAKNVINSFKDGFDKSNKIIAMTAHGLYSLIFKPKKNVQRQIGGPIVIGYFVGKVTVEGFKESLYTGFRSFFEIISMISLALAFFNLLPIPALDGGYVILNIYEIIFQKSINLSILYRVVMIFFILLLFIMFIIVPMDISKIINFTK
jgi:regulator of sigma E protease